MKRLKIYLPALLLVCLLCGCASLPAEQNRTLFDSYEDAINAGYTPCGNCMG